MGAANFSALETSTDQRMPSALVPGPRASSDQLMSLGRKSLSQRPWCVNSYFWTINSTHLTSTHNFAGSRLFHTKRTAYLLPWHPDTSTMLFLWCRLDSLRDIEWHLGLTSMPAVRHQKKNVEKSTLMPWKFYEIETRIALVSIFIYIYHVEKIS